MKIITEAVEVCVKITKDTDLGVTVTVNTRISARDEILIVGRMVPLRSRDFEKSENETTSALEITIGGKKCNSIFVYYLFTCNGRLIHEANYKILVVGIKLIRNASRQ